MDRARLIRLAAIVANSLSSTRRPGPNSLNRIQVTRFFHPAQSLPVCLSRDPCTYVNSPNSCQVYYFSSKPDSYIELVLSNDWSKELENELEKSSPKLTHESVVYVLMKLHKDPLKALEFFKWVRDRKGFESSSVLYNILLRILAGKGLMEQFWVVASEMKGKGFGIGRKTYLTVHGFLKQHSLDKDKAAWTKFFEDMNKDAAGNNVVNNAVKVILGSDWSDKVESKLKGLKFPLSEDFLVRVFKELWPEPLKALKFFEWVGNSLGFGHNAITYNELAKVLAWPASMGKFWDLVKQMRSEGYEMDTETYIKISRNLRGGDAVELFEFMMDGPYKPSEQDCGMLLRSISLDYDPDMDLVFKVVNRFEAEGNTLNKAIYDGIHRSLCKVGKFDEAYRIVEAMRNAGYQPDNITYSQEVFGFCKLSKFEEATKVLDRMEAEGCVPDIKTWTILIQGYCIAHQLDEALLCFGKMVEKNLNPDGDLLDVLLKGFLSQNKVLGAYTFLIGMVEKTNLRPWQATYKFMIKKLLEAGKLEEALNLLRMMKRHNYPPFPEPFAQYISKSGTLKDVDEFLKASTVKDPPSTMAYIHFIRSFIEEGRHSEAKDLLYKSPPKVRVHKAIGNLFGSADSTHKGSPPMSFVEP
uniref:Pentacotripeptide-repeat region of PRORP domain-containing protein n=1 Tax=Opuntia streptacantha TaxID=393608 RepID=A0A7C9DWL4_OPUST